MNNTNKKSFIKNVITLITGSVLAQLISLIGLILLQRYFYGPEDFAPFRLFFEFTAIFAGISALRLESAIVLESDNKNAKGLFIICLKLIVIISIVSLFSFFIFSFFNKGINDLAKDFRIVLLVPLTVISIGLFQVF